MKKRIAAGALLLPLILTAALPFSGCATAGAVRADDLTAGVQANNVGADVGLAGGSAEAVAGFAVALAQNSLTGGENGLISPLSVLSALAMTANGAAGATRDEMEQAFGLSVPELNAYLHAYLAALPSGDKYQLSPANSIWFKDDGSFTVVPQFLQANADYYGASIYKAAFDDATLKDINGWVRDQTDGMIESILDQIPEDAVMYLVNALAFDAEWQDIYHADQVREGLFTTESGKERQVELMYSEERQYLDDGRAVGFVKYYADQQYAFAALLPNQGLSVADYLASLTGAGLMETLSNAESVTVNAGLPKFTGEYSLEMSGPLQALGMRLAFDPGQADFSGLGSSAKGNIYISRVLHKTFIAVDERGTKAGAATAVEMEATSAPAEEPKTVRLDRPFVYLLIDCETNLPLFIGAVMDIGQ